MMMSVISTNNTAKNIVSPPQVQIFRRCLQISCSVHSWKKKVIFITIINNLQQPISTRILHNVIIIIITGAAAHKISQITNLVENTLN